MTDDGREANIAFFYPDHKGETILRAVHFAEEFIEKTPLGEIAIRLDMDHAEPGAGFFEADSLKDMLYYMLGPLLPPRKHTLNVRVRNNGSYDYQKVMKRDADGLPDWMEEFREEAIVAWEDQAESFDEEEGGPPTWPDSLAEWGDDDAPLVFFLHGFADCGATFQFVVDAFDGVVG